MQTGTVHNQDHSKRGELKKVWKEKGDANQGRCSLVKSASISTSGVLGITPGVRVAKGDVSGASSSGKYAPRTDPAGGVASGGVGKPRIMLDMRELLAVACEKRYQSSELDELSWLPGERSDSSAVS